MGLTNLLGIMQPQAQALDTSNISALMKQIPKRQDPSLNKTTVKAKSGGPLKEKSKNNTAVKQVVPAQSEGNSTYSSAANDIMGALNGAGIGKDGKLSIQQKMQEVMNDKNFQNSASSSLAFQNLALQDAQGKTPYENTLPLLEKVKAMSEINDRPRTGDVDLNFFENMYKGATGRSLGLQGANKNSTLEKMKLMLSAQKMANEAQGQPAKNLTDLFKAVAFGGPKLEMAGSIDKTEKAKGNKPLDRNSRVVPFMAQEAKALSEGKVLEFASHAADYADRLRNASSSADYLNTARELSAEYNTLSPDIRNVYGTGANLTQNEEKALKNSFIALKLIDENELKALGEQSIDKLRMKFGAGDLESAMKKTYEYQKRKFGELKDSLSNKYWNLPSEAAMVNSSREKLDKNYGSLGSKKTSPLKDAILNYRRSK